MMRRSLLIMITFILTGCHSDKTNTNGTNKIVEPSVKIQKETSPKKSTRLDTGRYTGPDDTVPKILIPDSAIQVVLDRHLPDTIKETYILLAGGLEKDDLTLAMRRARWKGLFLRKNGTAYIKDIRLIFEHNQSISDSIGQKTGWLVKSNNKDYGFFFAGIDELTNGPVQQVKLTKTTLYPGEKQVFTYNGINYTLYARGFKKDGDIYNYRLYLAANVKGHYYNQLLGTAEHFGDEMHWEADETFNIDFIGDIDGDKIPDVIITNSAAFSGGRNLFLSKRAGNDAILTIVASFWTSD